MATFLTFLGTLFGVSAIGAAAYAVIHGVTACRYPDDERYHEDIVYHLKRSYFGLGYGLVAIVLMFLLVSRLWNLQ